MKHRPAPQTKLKPALVKTVFEPAPKALLWAPTDVTSWGKITPVRCRLLELPLGVKMTAATTSCFTLLECLIFIPTSRFQKFLFKEQIQYPHLNAAKVS